MAPLNLLREDLTETADTLAARFRAAHPFPFVVIEDFLDADFARRLLASFPAFEQGSFIGDDGRVGGKSTHDRPQRLGEAWQALDRCIRSPEFLALIGRITGIDGLLYDPFYLGGGTHENRDGQTLDPHIDFNYHPSERWHRRLNLIVYLNPEWNPAWGGNLELFDDPHADPEPAQRISPVFNRCVIFETSERSWHGFDTLRLPEDRKDTTRRSVALYFYSKTRPAEETAGRHTTHYVKRQLPSRFRAGHVLDEADVATLRELLQGRDAHIRLQYEEIARLLQAQDRGLAGKLLYLAKRAYVRLRRHA